MDGSLWVLRSLSENISNYKITFDIKSTQIKEKIIEKSGYDEVFSVDGDHYNSSDYNTIKDNIQIKLYQ